MSIDSHSRVIHHWDDVAFHQWSMINNEFAVISNQPAPLFKNHKPDDVGGYKHGDVVMEGLERNVLRNCIILFNDYSVPVCVFFFS